LAAIGYAPQQDERLYGRHPEPDGEKLRASLCEHFGDQIALDRTAPGCVVYMRWHKRPNHVAIIGDYYLGGLSLIHALWESDRVVETRLAGPWPRRILGAWRP
jgi:cell wall-associated NlpC family hydrolase